MEQADFGPFFARRPGWARLYIHLPGMGQTLADPHVTNFDSLLGALLDALPGWTQGRPFALPGTSAGAYLAQGLVAAVPEQVLFTPCSAPPQRFLCQGWCRIVFLFRREIHSRCNHLINGVEDVRCEHRICCCKL